MTMRTIRLGGTLGKRYGRQYRLDVASVGEAVRALITQLPGFKHALLGVDAKGGGFRVDVADRNVTEEELTLVSEGDILIMPVYGGAKAGFRIVLGAVLVAAGVYFNMPTLTAVGASLILGGVIELLTPVPKTGDSQNPLESYGIGGGQALTQGACVGLIYGRYRTTPQLVSIGLEASDVVSVSGGGSGGGGGDVIEDLEP